MKSWIITPFLLMSIYLAGQPSLLTTSPANNAMHISPDTAIVLTFNSAIDGASVNADNIFIQGCQTGIIAGTFSGGGTSVITFAPSDDFKPGELISVGVTSALTGGGLALANPQIFSFSVAASIGTPAVDTSGISIIDSVDGVRSIAVGDIDGDGDIDILSGSYVDNKLAWHENDGTAAPSFVSNTVSLLGLDITDVALGDIDGNGAMDLLRTSSTGNNAAWFQNDGAADPVFTGHLISTTVTAASAIASGDLDNDGDLDVVTAAYSSFQIAWHENDGDSLPEFTDHTITTFAIGAKSVAVADLDGDGDLDVLSASLGDNKIAWYENDGGVSPTFAPHTVSDTSYGAIDVVVGDVNGDGHLDIIAASQDDNTLAWFENDGAANPLFSEHTISESEIQASGATASDLDGDGDLDILCSSRTNNRIAWFENDGNATPAFTEHVVTTSLTTAFDVVAADLNGDLRLDMIGASLADDEVRWYETLWQPELVSSNPAGNAKDVTTSTTISLTFNSIMDNLTINSNNISVHGSLTGVVEGSLLNVGTPTVVFDAVEDFQPGETISVSVSAGLESLGRPLANPQVFQFTAASSGHDPQMFSRQTLCADCPGFSDMEVGDIDGDGILDVAAVRASGVPSVVWQSSNGASLPEFNSMVVDSTALSVVDLELVDLDGDNDLDLLARISGADSTVWYENDGAGVPAFTRHFVNTQVSLAFKSGDLDADGDMDFVLAGDSIIAYFNDGAGIPAFTPVPIEEVPSPWCYSLAIGDINGDGHLDIAVGVVGALYTYLNDGAEQPSFTGYEILEHFSSPANISLGDLDSDGDLDLAYYTFNSKQIWWAENDGASLPTFTRNFVSGTDPAPTFNETDLHAIDINGDGHIDILSTTTNPIGSFIWYPNDGNPDPTFIDDASTYLIALDRSQDRIAIGDMDNDGDLDFVTSYDSTLQNLTLYLSNDGPWLVSHSPVQNANDVDLEAGVVMDFSDPLTPTSNYPDTANIVVHGSQSGLHHGTFYGLGTDHVTFTPSLSFLPGEQVSVSITQLLTYLDFPLNQYSVFEFNAEATAMADFEFVETALDSLLDGDPLDVSDGPTDIVIAEMNGDGLLDYIVASEDDGEIIYYYNWGQEWPAFYTKVVSPDMAGASGVDVGDMDADGNMDIVATAAVNNKLSVFRNSGGFFANFTETIISTQGDGVSDVRVGDLNGDGALDIVKASGNDSTIAVYIADGTAAPGLPNYTESFVDTEADSVLSLDIGDVDGDGDLDILAAAFNDNQVIWFANDGNAEPTFTRYVIDTVAMGAIAVTSGDLDGDGDLDAVAASFESDELAWYENDGGVIPGFSKHPLSATGDGANGVGVIDLDGDGDLDIFRTSLLDNSITWFENDGASDPAFNEATLSTSVPGPRGIAFGDMDSDGDIDVLTTSYEDNRIYFYETDHIKETEVRFQDGVLRVKDINGGTSNDRLTITRNIDSLTVHDPTLTLRAVGEYLTELDSHTVVFSAPYYVLDEIVIDGVNGLDSIDISFQSGTRDLLVQNVDYIRTDSILTTDHDISLFAEQSIEIQGSIRSEFGSITLHANQQDPPTSGNFTGVKLFPGNRIYTYDGTISIAGRGGDNSLDGRDNFGVSIGGGQVFSLINEVDEGEAAISIAGYGGAPGLSPGYGIYLADDAETGSLTLTHGLLTIIGSSQGVPEILHMDGGAVSVTGTGTIQVVK